MIVARCLQCGKRYRAAGEQAGRRLRCKACGGVVPVPLATATAGPTTSTPPPLRPTSDLPVDQPLPLPPGGTGATHPARAAVDLAQYFWCYPAAPMLILILGLTGLVGAVASGQWWLVPVCLAGGCIRAAIRFLPQIRLNARRFLIGNVNPAVVLPRDGNRGPWRVAVLTDLATRPGVEAPVIRIANAPLSRMAGGPPRAGMRLTAPSLYGSVPGESPDRWTTFAPVIANCCIRSTPTLNRLVRLVPEADWRELDARLAALPERRPGLYRLWPGGRPTYDATTNGPIARAGLAVALAVIVGSLVLVTAVRLGWKPRNDAPMAPQPLPTPYRPSPPRPPVPDRMFPPPDPNQAERLFRQFNLNHLSTTHPL